MNNTDLYRIISFESFMQLILYKTERFVNPLTWEDTFEGCGLRYVHDEKLIKKFVDALFAMYNNESGCGDDVLFNFVKAEIVRDYSFGQSWSLISDSDAMWRIYNYNNHAIQIQSSIEQIQRYISIFNDTNTDNNFKCEIKKVKYDVLNEDKEEAYAKFYRKGMDFSTSYFHKRKAFEHEQEVRVLIRPENIQLIFHRQLNQYRRHISNVRNAGNEITSDMLVNAINIVHSCNGPEYSLRNINLNVSIDNMKEYITDIKVHPKAEDWYVELINNLCDKYGIPFGGRSSLYGEA